MKELDKKHGNDDETNCCLSIEKETRTNRAFLAPPDVNHIRNHLFDALGLGPEYLFQSPGEVFLTPIEWIPQNPRPENYPEIFVKLPLFSRMIFNTFYVTTLGTLGAVFSSVTVAYGLSRINWPGRQVVFIVLIATLMLPGIVTLIPLFIMFNWMGWVGTFYPLWVPAWLGISLLYLFNAPIYADLAQGTRRSRQN